MSELTNEVEASSGQSKRPKQGERTGVLDQTTADALRYLAWEWSDEPAVPLNYNVVVRLVLDEAELPVEDAPFFFPEIEGLAGNDTYHFWLYPLQLARWQELTTAYQTILNHQVAVGMRSPGTAEETDSGKVTAFDVLRYVIQQAAALWQGEPFPPD